MILDLLRGKKREPAECIIRLGTGAAEISDLYPYLTEVRVDASRAQPTTATLTFMTRRHDQGQWLIQDDGRLTPWEPLRIEAAFGTSSEEVMRGYIREIRADYPADAGSATLTVICQDDTIAMDREHIRKVWGGEAPAMDLTIASTIIANHGLAPDPANGSGQSNLVINQDSTDIVFLRRRAEANGYELLCRHGQIYFGPLRLDAAPQPTIMVYAGEATHCSRFSVSDDGHQAEQVAFDRSATEGSSTMTETLDPDLTLLGTEAVGSSGKGLPAFAWRLSRQGGMGEDEWRARAQRKVNELSLKVRAEGELDGSRYGHVLLVGEPVGVDGVGERYGGTYLVDQVSHCFNHDGYRQQFRFLRNAYGDNLGSGASGLLAGVLGG